MLLRAGHRGHQTLNQHTLSQAKNINPQPIDRRRWRRTSNQLAFKMQFKFVCENSHHPIDGYWKIAKSLATNECLSVCLLAGGASSFAFQASNIFPCLGLLCVYTVKLLHDYEWLWAWPSLWPWQTHKTINTFTGCNFTSQVWIDRN